MRIGVLTGGGDCPGLNAVLRAVVRTAAHAEDPIDVIGIEDGFDGLVTGKGMKRLTTKDVQGILSQGGTILGTSNRGNPFNYPVKNDDGTVSYEDKSSDCMAQMAAHNLDGLVVVGGDGTLKIAHELTHLGARVVGVPKTIDNDLHATAYTFGFDSAVNVAVEALDRLKTTAESHDRMMIMEVMGRYAGWIALHVGFAGGANAVLIPEIPYNIQSIKAHLLDRLSRGPKYHLVVVAEGAMPVGGSYSFNAGIKESAGADRRLGGAADALAHELSDMNIETRTLVLGHLQRGGTPTYRDRLLGSSFGSHAVELVIKNQWDRMVCLQGNSLESVPLVDAVGTPRLVSLDSDVMRFARNIGICLGD